MWELPEGVEGAKGEKFRQFNSLIKCNFLKNTIVQQTTLLIVFGFVWDFAFTFFVLESFKASGSQSY